MTLVSVGALLLLDIERVYERIDNQAGGGGEKGGEKKSGGGGGVNKGV